MNFAPEILAAAVDPADRNTPKVMVAMPQVDVLDDGNNALREKQTAGPNDPKVNSIIGRRGNNRPAPMVRIGQVNASLDKDNVGPRNDSAIINSHGLWFGQLLSQALSGQPYQAPPASPPDQKLTLQPKVV